MLVARRRSIFAGQTAINGVSPSVGTVTPFANSDIAGGSRQFAFQHDHTGGSNAGIVLCVVMKGQTDVGPPTFTLDKVSYNNAPMAEIGRNYSNLRAQVPTVLAFSIASPSTGANDIEFDITPSANNIQCIGMVAMDLTDFIAVGSGADQDDSDAAGTSLALTVPVTQNNGLVIGIASAQRNSNGGTFDAPAGYAEHADTDTGGASPSTDIGFAVHSKAVPIAGSEGYAPSWLNSAAFGGLAFEIQGVI